MMYGLENYVENVKVYKGGENPISGLLAVLIILIILIFISNMLLNKIVVFHFIDKLFEIEEHKRKLEDAKFKSENWKKHYLDGKYDVKIYKHNNKIKKFKISIKRN